MAETKVEQCVRLAEQLKKRGYTPEEMAGAVDSAFGLTDDNGHRDLLKLEERIAYLDQAHYLLSKRVQEQERTIATLEAELYCPRRLRV